MSVSPLPTDVGVCSPRPTRVFAASLLSEWLSVFFEDHPRNVFNSHRFLIPFSTYYGTTDQRHLGMWQAVNSSEIFEDGNRYFIKHLLCTWLCSKLLGTQVLRSLGFQLPHGVTSKGYKLPKVTQ